MTSGALKLLKESGFVPNSTSTTNLTPTTVSEYRFPILEDLFVDEITRDDFWLIERSDKVISPEKVFKYRAIRRNRCANSVIEVNGTTIFETMARLLVNVRKTKKPKSGDYLT